MKRYQAGLLSSLVGLALFFGGGVKAGAGESNRHWAYQPLQKPAIPTVGDKTWPENPIDRFVLSRLEEEGLTPSEEADRHQMIRRLSLDLRGLPPSPEEIERFLNDASPDAYADLVDRLLATPHFGERMAIRWLDWVRYADTVGYHGDQPVSVWPYRDYVIRSFNENKPFDQFTIEQLAGDLLPDATRQQRIASAYNRLNRMTSEGGAQPKEYIAKYAADRVRTTSTVWMGATLGCAECHDHKFDPYTAKDFYSFSAFFADLKERGVYSTGNWGAKVTVPTSQEEKKLARLEARTAELQRALSTTTEELANEQAQWERRLREQLEADKLAWQAVVPESVDAKNGTKLEVLGDRSVLSSGPNPESETYVVSFQPKRDRITALRLEVLTHETFDKKSLSRAGGNFVLTEVEVRASEGEASRRIAITGAKADYEQGGYPVSALLDDNPKTGWAVDGHTKAESRRAVLTLEEPLDVAADAKLTVRLKHESKHKRHQIGRFRLSTSSVEGPDWSDRGLPDEVVEALRAHPDDRSEGEAERLAEHYREIAPSLDPVRRELARIKEERDELKEAMATCLVSKSIDPRVVRVLPRGNWMDDSGEIVSPSVPHFLPQIEEAEGDEGRATRLDLAEWLVSPRNPLTSRVIVNRLWAICFGNGLSETMDDFGTQGERPTHPELLDWLATTFVERGWDIKGMLRLMVTSKTYRQTSVPTPKLRRADPDNRLYARQSRFRLPAEMVRDNALAISGLLVREVGGPSVKPYQPDGYYAQLNFPKRTYQEDHGPSQYRRGVYTHWQRTFLHPSLKAFDAPSREECTVQRSQSNTPLQALALLNDPTYVEAARVLGERIASLSEESFDDRLRRLYLRALARPPSPKERELMSELYSRHEERYRANPEDAKALLSNGDQPVPQVDNEAEHAAWTSVSRVVLNLHETIVRQ